jgi:hypothetical protein
MGSIPGASRQTSCIFPSLTDGFIPDPVECRRKGQQKMLIKLDEPISGDEAIVASAWALTVGKYIGTQDVAFYVAQQSSLGQKCAMLSVKVDDECSLSLVIERSRRSLGTMSPSSISSEYANTAIAFDDELPESLNDVSDTPDQC